MQRDPRTGWERWLKPCTQRLKAGGLSRGRDRESAPKGGGRRKPTEDAPGSSPPFYQLPSQGASAAAPTNSLAQLLAHPCPAV